ncbi:hypothetical protein Peur_049707 [Populus x canadensis]
MLKPSSLKTFNISTSSSPSTSFSTPKHYHPQSTSHPLQEAFRSSSRRDLNLSVLALLITGSLQNLSNNITLAQELELERYTDSKEGFTLRRPSSYVQVDKAGATVLFEEANKGSNNIGVVVTPESTKDAEVISVAERSGHGGLQVYEFEYKVDSTRGGMKRSSQLHLCPLRSFTS